MNHIFAETCQGHTCLEYFITENEFSGNNLDRHEILRTRYAISIATIKTLHTDVPKFQHLETQKLLILISFRAFWNHFSLFWIIVDNFESVWPKGLKIKK